MRQDGSLYKISNEECGGADFKSESFIKKNEGGDDEEGPSAKNPVLNDGEPRCILAVAQSKSC